MLAAMITAAFRAPNLTIGYEDQLLVAVWTGPPRSGQISEITRVASRVSAERGHRVALFDVIAEGRPDFTDAVRSEGAKVASDPGGNVSAVAHVVVPKGLVGSALWAFVSTMTLLGRSRAPTKVFGDLDEGAEWLASKLANQWTKARVLQAYQELRST